jgi:hypothetical protein
MQTIITIQVQFIHISTVSSSCSGILVVFEHANDNVQYMLKIDDINNDNDTTTTFTTGTTNVSGGSY